MDYESKSDQNDSSADLKVNDLLGYPDMSEKFEEALERLTISENAFKDIHDQFKDDVSFGLLGNQWDGQLLNQRKIERRTTHVFNKCVSNIRYVVNSSMKNPPAIKVHPISNATKETAKIYDGLIKHIENESNAKDIYTNSLQDAVAGGLGVFKICTKNQSYINEPNEELYIERIIDPTSVYPDPEAIEPDFSDINYLFQVKKISKKSFEKKYPGKESQSLTDKNSDWFDSDSVKVVEYWMRNEDGSISWHILNGNEIIDSSDYKEQPYPGKYIPYSFVIGEDIILDGERHLKSIIRDVKDYQRTLNYMQSESVDYVSKHAKSPYMASDASIAPYKELWDNVNTKNYPYLPYVDGKAVPQRIDPPPAPIGFIDSIQRLDQDIRQTIGIRDPLQDIPESSSGKAIKLQMAQGNLGTYVWIDHLIRSIKHAGKILVDLIPHFYNYPHIQQILGLDGQMSTVNIMQPDFQNNQPQIDLSGKYSVTISTGSNYEDQREETYDKLLELFKINPNIAQIGGDMLVRNMDFSESNELADRIAATIDPKIIAASKPQNENQLKQQFSQLQSQFNHSQQMIEQITNVLNQKNEEVQMLNQKLNDKFSSEQIKSQTELQKTDMNNKNDIVIENIKGEYDLKLKQMEKEIEHMKAILQPQGPKNIHTETHETNISSPMSPIFPY